VSHVNATTFTIVVLIVIALQKRLRPPAGAGPDGPDVSEATR
jgi:hypothetical protein